MLEIGAFNGISANSMLEYIFINKESVVYTINPFLPDITTPEVDNETQKNFFENLEIGGHKNQIILFQDNSKKVLLKLNEQEKYIHFFDCVYIDGSHLVYDVLIDAILTWDLLKVGGTMIFDDYKWNLLSRTLCPKVAIDLFISSFQSKIKVLYRREQVFLRKIKN